MMMRWMDIAMTRLTGSQVRQLEIEMDPNGLEALKEAGQTMESFVQDTLKRAHDRLMVDYWGRKRAASE
jgi:hypothetical protein